MNDRSQIVTLSSVSAKTGSGPSRVDRGLWQAPESVRFTREEIVGAIRRWHAIHGEPPLALDWDPTRARRRDQGWRADRFDAGRWPTLAMVRRQFGTLTEAVAATGITPRRAPIR